MQKTVYYLVDRHTGRRLKYYTTLAGAGIAQRSRNCRLGFVERIERVQIEHDLEAEQCRNSDNLVVCVTYCIQEDTIDSPDLIAYTTTHNTTTNNKN